MIDKTVKIYILENPVTNEIFYVGKSKSNLKLRLSAHVSNRTRTSTLSTYIRNLYDLHGITPIISEIDECCEAESNTVEKYWIHQLSSWGFRLCNHVHNKSKINVTAHTKPTKEVILLTLDDVSIYEKLKEIAKKQRWSVNTLINSVLEDLVIMQEPKKQTAA